MSKNDAYAPLVRASVAACIGAAAMLGSFPVSHAAEAEDEEIEELEEVKVTGTRIQVPGTYTAANPMTSVTAEEMQSLGIVNVADALTTLVPANISTYTPGMIGDNQAGSGGAGIESMDRGSYFIGNTIANLRGMDPAFGSRTLTMIDGRRVVSSSNQADVVDMNSIPSNLVQRMDVVTGGASATYGSGAMAGVVNVVLNNRLTGVNVDLDYGVNEAGDGGNPHFSIAGGMPLFGGRGHGLLSVEWEKRNSIRNCATARDWCAESRYLFTNGQGSLQDKYGELAPMPGYEDFPARFEMYNQRYSQFSPNGVVGHSNALVTNGFRFSDDGTTGEEYSYGYRGGTGASAVNGDGPVTTFMTPLNSGNERRNLFSNFEYSFSDTTTGYFQGRYSDTKAKNYNGYTTGSYCMRFDTAGQLAQPGGQASAGSVVTYGIANIQGSLPDGTPYRAQERSPLVNFPAFREMLGIVNPPGLTAPWAIIVNDQNRFTGPTVADNPSVAFNGRATGKWSRVKLTLGNLEYWLLDEIVLNENFPGFSDPGIAAQLPQLGRNAYAFLNDLSPEALYQVQKAFGVGGLVAYYGTLQNPETGALLTGFPASTGGSASPGLSALYGDSACSGFSVVRKVWDPQIQRWTSNNSETLSFTTGVKGRFGQSWNWDVYYQYGHTDSESVATNVPTNLRLAMALDAVIDDDPGSPTYGQPICRILRDGPPVLDANGLPLSAPDELMELAAGCTPLNVFGSHYDDPVAAERQRQALDYAFVDTSSGGGTTLHTLSLNTSGTLWDGWRAGPLTAAFGFEVRENKVTQTGTVGADSFYERTDLARVWADAFSGKSRVTEAYTEFNMPLVSGVEGANALTANVGVRWASYYNKGGAGTTGESATNNVLNWKFSTVYEPFDFVRLRLTRSRDLRAPGYRDLFLNQPGIPDGSSGNNPWRERSAFSTENQFERWATVRVGNPNLKNEKSDTTTLGIVLQPGGMAQGMRISVDYFTISMKDAIVTPFSALNPIRACWEASGNIEPTYLGDGEIDPENPGINGLFDENAAACREITFGTNPDGSRNLQDIVSHFQARPANALPIKRRGLDFSWQYTFPMSRVYETLPGTFSLTVRGTRALEASGVQVNYSILNNESNCAARGGYLGTNQNCYIPLDLVGQIRSNIFVPGVTASPTWTGNVITSYRVRNLTTSLAARYVGGARLDKQWCDPDQFGLGTCDWYQDEEGRFLNGSVDRNWVDSYFNFTLNGTYDVPARNMRQMQVFASINNLFDKTPPFSGGGISGASPGMHDTLGRSYRLGVRMRF